MQNVSKAWKSNHENPLVSESFLEISYEVSDPAARSDATATDNGHSFYSDAAAVVNETEKSPKKYGTLEPDIWPLDGTCEIVPDAAPFGNNGFIGDVLSDANGNYAVPPTITVQFTMVHSVLVPGITITWAQVYGEYADTFRVTVFQGATTKLTRTVTGNKTVTSILNIDIKDYDRITVEVLKWGRSDRRARISSILVGLLKVYMDADIITYTHSMEVNPLSAALPKSEIVFTVDNADASYNPDNPIGETKYLIERQQVKSRYGYKFNGQLEWIPGGTFWTSGWETPQNGITATFTARDVLEFMDDIYTGALTGTLRDIAERALVQAKLPRNADGTVRWKLDSSLGTIAPPSIPSPDEYSLAEILQLVANAACCVLYQDRTGTLHIEPLHAALADYAISQDNSYENAEIELSKLLKSVNVNDGAYILPVSDSGNEQPIKNPFISAERAPSVAQWAAKYLKNRRVLTGDWRADPRLDPLDLIATSNQFASSQSIVTEVVYDYAGSFKGKYEGRVIAGGSYS